MTTLRSLLHHDTHPLPHLDSVSPSAAMPGGQIDVLGSNLEPIASHVPSATIGDTPSPVTLSRPTRATISVPEGTGIMLDDIGAGLYALAIFSLIHIVY